MNRSIVAAGMGMVMLSACGGGGGSVMPHTAAAQATHAPSRGTAAALTVIVPQKSSSSAVRRPAYVSPSSAQLLVAINAATPATYALTPETAGCTTVQANLQCTFSVAAAAGEDSIALTLEDASGNVLSKNVVTAKLAAGASTPVNVTLAGIPASVLIAPGTGSAIEDTATPAYHVPGMLPEPVELEALDADGNIIIGPGAPTIAAPTITSGSTYASIVSADTTDPNAYILTPSSASADGQTIAISATAQSIPMNDGTQSTPVTSATNFLFTPAIAVASGPLILEYSVETQNQIAGINVCGGCPGEAIADASDAHGNLWVALSFFSGGAQVQEYPAGSRTVSVALSGTAAGVTGVVGIATGANGMLYVANEQSGTVFSGGVKPASVSEYSTWGATAPTAPTYKITGSALTAPVAVGADSSGNVYVANSDGTIPVYAGGASQTAPTSTISSPSLVQPQAMAVDPAGDLYVYDSVNQDIAYIPAGTGTVTQTLFGANFGNIGNQIALDPSGDLLLGETNEVEVLSASALPSGVQDLYFLPTSGAAAWLP